jgi:hypothetical protein
MLSLEFYFKFLGAKVENIDKIEKQKAEYFRFGRNN